MKKEILEELQEIAPDLAKIKRPDLPEVPSMYFEGFTDRLLRNMEIESVAVKPQTKQNGFFSKLRHLVYFPQLVLASVLLLLAVSFWLLYPNNFNNENKNFSLQSVESAELINYVDVNIDQFDVQSIAENVNLEKVSDNLLLEIGEKNELDKAIEDNLESINAEDLL